MSFITSKRLLVTCLICLFATHFAGYFVFWETLQASAKESRSMFRGWLVLQLAELCFICLTCLIMHDRGYSSLANDMMESRTERPNQEEVLPITKEMHYPVGEKVDASV